MNESMPNIQRLIAEKCPEGVEFKTLGEVAEVGTGSSNGNEAIEGGAYPLFVRSKFIKHIDTYEFDEEAIIIPGEGGVGEIFHYIKGKYALHQRAYRIHFVAKDICAKFAYYYLFANFKVFITQHAVNATVSSIRKPMIEKFKIPIPPLQVQQEIVRILDSFTKLEAELEAELEARRKQYEYYRDELLTFGEEVEWKTLGDVAVTTIGEFVHKNKQNPSAEYPVYNGGTSPTGYYHRSNNTGNKIIVSARGANAGFVNKLSEPYWAGNSCYSISIEEAAELNWEFVFYFLKRSENKLIGEQQRGGIPAVSKKQIEVFCIPIPPLAKQAQIVSILDKFDALVASTSSATDGLPAELAARRKQYEYYRNQLLTFKEYES